MTSKLSSFMIEVFTKYSHHEYRFTDETTLCKDLLASFRDELEVTFDKYYDTINRGILDNDLGLKPSEFMKDYYPDVYKESFEGWFDMKCLGTRFQLLYNGFYKVGHIELELIEDSIPSEEEMNEMAKIYGEE